MVKYTFEYDCWWYRKWAITVEFHSRKIGKGIGKATHRFLFQWDDTCSRLYFRKSANVRGNDCMGKSQFWQGSRSTLQPLAWSILRSSTGRLKTSILEDQSLNEKNIENIVAACYLESPLFFICYFFVKVFAPQL